MGVPVIGDPSAFGVDPEPLGPVALSGDPLEGLKQVPLQLLLGKTVGSPDDHRRPADQALGHPALFVLEEPVGQALGVTQEAVGFGVQLVVSNLAWSPTTMDRCVNHRRFASIAIT